MFKLYNIFFYLVLSPDRVVLVRGALHDGVHLVGQLGKLHVTPAEFVAISAVLMKLYSSSFCLRSVDSLVCACSVPGTESAHVCTLSKAEGEAPSWKIGTVARLGSHVDVVDLMAHGGLRGVLHAVGEGPV